MTQFRTEGCLKKPSGKLQSEMPPKSENIQMINHLDFFVCFAITLLLQFFHFVFQKVYRCFCFFEADLFWGVYCFLSYCGAEM